MSEVFIKKPATPALGFNIMSVLRKKATKGRVGLEIEVEGNKFPKSNEYIAPYWEYHKDGSLRGQDNAEYVLRRPIEFSEVPDAVNFLWGQLGAYGSVLSDSNRTSVHVHLNCQTFHFNRLAAFSALYFCFEEVLTGFCGDHRVGNLFCLRAKDAPAIVSSIKKFIKTEGRFELRDGLHYAGFNCNALVKFGSIEIRTLRGVLKPEEVIQWVAILQRLYDLSETYADPRDLCDGFSGAGPMAFFEKVFGELTPLIRAGCGMSESEITEALYEGIRFAQDICYCRDWAAFKAVELKPDPFGRDARSIMKQLLQQAGQPDAPTTGIGSILLPSMHGSLPSNLFSEEPEEEEWFEEPE